jgi:hypothetical protein
MKGARQGKQRVYGLEIANIERRNRKTLCDCCRRKNQIAGRPRSRSSPGRIEKVLELWLDEHLRVNPYDCLIWINHLARFER